MTEIYLNLCRLKSLFDLFMYLYALFLWKSSHIINDFLYSYSSLVCVCEHNSLIPIFRKIRWIYDYETWSWDDALHFKTALKTVCAVAWLLFVLWITIIDCIEVSWLNSWDLQIQFIVCVNIWFVLRILKSMLLLLSRCNADFYTDIQLKRWLDFKTIFMKESNQCFVLWIIFDSTFF